MDTTRPDHLGCYGSTQVKTPQIDRLAARSSVFLDATSPAPTTLAAHTSIMTGRTPRAHGVARNGFVVHADNEMLAEVLARAGFHTAAFLGSMALEAAFAFDQGFGHFDADFQIEFSPTTYDQSQRRAEAVTDAVLEHLDRSRAERYFLFVHYFDPHAPYDAPAPWNAMYARDRDVPSSASLDDLDRAARAHYGRAGYAGGQESTFKNGLTRELLAAAEHKPSGADLDLAAAYAAEISYLDHHIGRLLEGLEERGLLEHAIVVVTADHGETFWEHADVWNHGLWVYDTTLRVPLIVHLPDGRGAGARIGDSVSTLDILPTLLELLDLPSARDLEGRSLVDAIDGRAFQRGPIACEATQPTAVESGQSWPNERKAKCMRSGRWKYVVAPYLDLEELYDLREDPLETKNLLEEQEGSARSIARDLEKDLNAWMKATRPLPSRFNPDPITKRLRALGYFDDEPVPER
jgi:arylsulfatase A-like enzyme